MKKFLPLITIFLLIVIFTLLRVWERGNTNMFEWMNDFMAGFFIIFGGLKVLKWRNFVEAYRTYDILAKKSKLYAYLYPLIELALGIAYFIRFQPLITNWVTLIIMLIGSIGVLQTLMTKEKIPCACLGTVFKVPMTSVTLVEDLLMAVMALTMIITL